MLLGSLLVACSADMDELSQWMEQQKREAKPTIKPLVPPKKFLPQPYEAAAGVDPYSPQKLSVAIKQEAAQPNSLLSAEMNRRREPLEAYPLDSMSMVGSMMRQGQRYALLRADNLLYRVKDGEHLGLNFGRVMKISETEITLREVVQDAAGEWVERTSTLQLQEQGR
ncbi:pilus assembly protein PilP [Roseateles albus]|uniref:Pilus assembly protein PilP n=1 Tax=Roseateles albus TaxID=2987525 RepID=A0ABT5KFH3_9BURK|nr:pilus assembly protein PilP [Roseateles albus]MDC8771571.1 pilus assembly protein PilP [Roseateles albus]